MSRYRNASVWRPDIPEKKIVMRTKCIDCGVLLTPDRIRLKNMFCAKCAPRSKKTQEIKFSKQIQNSYKDTLIEMKKTKSHSLKGKNAKGFNIDTHI